MGFMVCSYTCLVQWAESNGCCRKETSAAFSKLWVKLLPFSQWRTCNTTPSRHDLINFIIIHSVKYFMY